MDIKSNQIYNVDCLKGMVSMEKESVDLIVTDPPFAINFKAKKANYNRIGSRVLEDITRFQRKNIISSQRIG